jgi:lipopolysaccharide/colanic/teichoic acid biosynthesis glycosyltransferase
MTFTAHGLATAADARGWFRERLLVVGRSPLTAPIVQRLEWRHPRHLVLGIVDDEDVAPTGGALVLGRMADLARIVDETRPDRVLVALGERRRRTPVRALLESCVARGIVVEDAAEFYERLTGKVAVESLAPTSMVFCGRFGPSYAQQLVSRAISLLAAAAGLMLLSPLLLLIAVAVKLDSTGPVLFVHRRVGLFGRPFKLLKFRTMHAASSPRSEWERDNRDRVTRVGRVLRAFRLDELPQFVNILRGEMNLVGPRPHPASNFELFTLIARNLSDVTGGAVGYYTLRSMVRPGITGWAQVRYRYANDLEEEIEKLRYDLYYVKYVSTRLDLRILAETVKVMVAGRPESTAREAQPGRAAAAPAAASLATPVNHTQAA